MKKLLPFALLFLSLPALAVDDGSKDAEELDEGDASVTYSSGGFSKISIDDFQLDSNTTLKFDDPVAITGTVGYRVPSFPGLGLELDFATAIIPGQITVRDCTTTGGTPANPITGTPATPGTTRCDESDGGDVGVNIIALNAVYRSQGKFYGMGKVGYGYARANIEGLPEKRSGSSYALGVGYRWSALSKNSVELVIGEANKVFQTTGLNFIYGFGGRD